MGLFGTLVSSTGALRVFQKALEVAQNNVSNMSTPGFAKQRLLLEAMPFDPGLGLPGGVFSPGVDSYRSEYAEQAVRRRQEDYGLSDQLAAELSRLEPYFDVTGTSGIPGALNRFFQSISAWSVVPNDQVARAGVIEQAVYLAGRVRDTASSLARARAAADQQICNTVDSINYLAGIIRNLNAQLRQDYRAATDPGVDARQHTALEELARYVDYSTVRQADGTLTVLLGGQTPLVIGERQYEIHAEISGASAAICDTDGREITAQASRGRLGGLIQFRNTTLPAFVGDLDRLAASVADRVNGILAGGIDVNGQPGGALFAYDPAQGAAASLRVTTLRPEELAGALAGAPGGNGNVLELAGLVDSPEIDGASFMGYYGALARNVGRALERAREDLKTSEQLLLQARSLRDEISGVSLDEEAIRLVEFQLAYQASARLVMVLSELTEITINLVR